MKKKEIKRRKQRVLSCGLAFRITGGGTKTKHFSGGKDGECLQNATKFGEFCGGKKKTRKTRHCVVIR